MTDKGGNYYRGRASIPSGNEGARVVSPRSPASGSGQAASVSRRGFVLSLLGLGASVAALGAGTATWVFAKDVNESMNKAFDLDGIPDRPDKVVEGAMNILILGTDARDEDQDGRSDSSMLMHVDAAGENAYVISIPRDLWVHIPHNEHATHSDTMAKFNAAYAWGGAALSIQTLEAYTGVRVDHVVEINFPGLVKVVDALDGVDMYIEKTITSIHPPRRTFEQGWNRLNGEEALDYIRQRYQFSDGDYTRMRNQQQLITAILDRAASAGVLRSQSTVTEFVESTAGALSVDTQFNAVGTALAFMHLRSDDIQFMTSPNLGTGYEGGESVIYSDDALAEDLFAHVRDDQVDQWVANNPDALNEPTSGEGEDSEEGE
ncbi:LCP family protein [Natronoglycomyces albus]|uniref:LCP family protein n=1 Tax=Natronoglycomyces albus TaxID=2811108 RepID=A0A895XMN0_9ACTN|nr:LCP family protein [Natronoglycomyces albus]QSB05022.1 LCP family protein [Natronoglycomyces albus]